MDFPQLVHLIMACTHTPWKGGAMVSTGTVEARVAGRGAAGPRKTRSNKINANDYEYAMAA